VRALLVVNPSATATTPRSRDVLVRALGSELKLDVAVTRRRGHAAALAAAARRDGLDLVISLGGDGTVNEVVNGLLRAGPDPQTALGVVPAGDGNVLARTLDIPLDPVEATSALLDGLRGRRFRSIGLGRADDRYFTFTAGLGVDASAVRAVELARRRGRRSTATRYARAALSRYLFAADRRHPGLAVRLPGQQEPAGAFVVIVSNTSPWTYLGDRGLRLSPRAGFDTGLDVLALRRFGPLAVARTAAAFFGDGPAPDRPYLLTGHDLDWLEVRAERPVDFQVDGESLGERTAVRFAAAPDALRVLLPGAA
jgi:diacylglycerol kinase family enzyme